MKQIQWYPGHMAKAQREITEKLKLVDVVYELLDARIPISSANPILPSLVKGKPRVILLNKASLADPIQTDGFVKYYESIGIKAIPIDAISGDNLNQIMKETKKILAAKIESDKKKGYKTTAIRAMILGIPNVGKSTLINKIAARSATKTGDKPGVTKSQQWINVTDELVLLDTPGILWPKFDNDDIAFRLAVSGAIKDDILPIDDVCIYLLKYLDKYYPSYLANRYGLAKYDIENIVDIYEQIARKRGCMAGSEADYEKVSRLILHDYRNLRIGRVSLDRYGEY